MTDDKALLAAILANPEEDTPRLAMADWLDEQPPTSPCPKCHGEGYDPEVEWPASNGCVRCDNDGTTPATGRVPSGFAVRAEFIRVQVELAAGLITTRHGVEYSLRPDRVAELRRRERELWAMGHPVCPFEMPHPDFNYFIDATLDDRPGMKAVVSRGFVSAVTLPARLFLGGACGECRETGRYLGMNEDSNPGTCPRCVKGRAPGLAGPLFAAHPITTVRLSGAEPEPNQYGGDRHSWTFGDPPVRPSDVPYSLIRAMTERLGEDPDGRSWVSFPTRQTALDALSAALCDIGRAGAKKPPAARPR